MTTNNKTTAPVYTIKSFKSFAQMSHETLCCHATLYRDGKKIGIIQNQGFGGPTDFDGDRDELNILIAHVATLPHHICSWDENETFPITVDHFLSTMTEDAEELKWVKNQCRSKTLFRLVGDDENSWRTFNCKFDQKIHDHITTKYAGRIEEILNLRLVK